MPSVEDNMTVKINGNYSMRRIVIIILVCSPQHNCNYKNFLVIHQKLSKRIVNPRRIWRIEHTNNGCVSAMTAKNITVY